MSGLPTPKAFIYGLRSSVYESCYLSTEQLLEQVGGNTGNLAFHHAIEKILGMTPPPRVFDWSTSIDQLTEISGLMVIPCANQYGAHMDMGGSAKKLQSLPQKVVAMGLGVQAASLEGAPNTPEGTIRWVRALDKRRPSDAPNIAVRGEFSRQIILEQTGVETIPLGCPSLLISPNPHLGQDIRQRTDCVPTRVMVLAAHHLWKHLTPLESALTNELTLSGGSYILQSDHAMFRLLRDGASSMTVEELSDIRDTCRPGEALDRFITWYRRFAISFYDISAWLEYCRSFDFAVGARIHGVVIAMQAGIPGVCICHDSRTLELCRTMQVPHVDIRNITETPDLAYLARIAASHNWNEFDSNRRRLAAGFSQFLQVNTLEPSPHLVHLARSVSEGEADLDLREAPSMNVK